MNADVMRAILAMDSYNRGYGKGVIVAGTGQGIDQGEIGRRLGTATITAQDVSEDALAAGFYASAYSWNGQTYISYRGTNTDTVGPDGSFWTSPFFQDALNGWTLGAAPAPTPLS